MYPINVLALIILVLFGGCTPTKTGEPEPQPALDLEVLALRSQPAGAVARLSTGESCLTPCSVQKAPDSRFNVVFEKEGYLPKTVAVSNNLELLRKFNSRNQNSRENIDQIQVQNLRLTPNPVTVTLEPAWSKY